MICARMQTAVSGLEQEFPGKVKTHNIDATAPDAVKAVHDLGFKSHGVVLRSSDGQSVWKQADHAVRMDDVRKAVTERFKP